MKRVSRLFIAAAALARLCFSADAAESKFSFETLRDRAQAMAAKPYAPAKGEAPDWLRRLTYDELRLIEFLGQHSLGFEDKLPFMVQYLHPGFLFDKMVHLSEVKDGEVKPIPFRKELFNYRSVKPGVMPETMGFAGFRLMYPFDGPSTRHNEIGSFAGASYFRFLSRDAAYGLSARGLAINTADPEPEEFPMFTDFWFERVSPGATSMNVYALMDSESVTGAYRFT